MEKINFEAGTQVNPAKVTIDNVDHEITPAVWEGNTPLSPYVLNTMQSNIENAISESGVIVSATEPTGNNREKVWLKKSKNLYNAEQNINVSQTDTYHRVDLKANTTYTISFIKSRLSGETITGNIIYKFATIRCFDKTGTKISDISSSTVTLTSGSIEIQQTFITPNNLAYVGINFGNNNGDTNVNTTVSNIQIEQGTTATTYEPYVEPKMYCLNDNNVYEEFIQKENKKYSTEEQRIGTFLGKPLYKKTLNLNTPSTTSNTEVGNFDSNFIVRNYYGHIKIAASNQLLPINFYFTEEYNIATYVTNSKDSQGKINMKVGIASYTNQPTTITLEYTKTTD